MIDRSHENPGPGSSVIPEAGRSGDTALPPRVSRNERAGTRPKNEELEWARRNVEEEQVPRPVREVFRKTALHDTPPPEEVGLRGLRTKMLHKLNRKRPEILYMPFEAAFRDFITSLLARQYREEEELRQQIAAILEQTGELQDELEKKIVRLDRRLDLLEDRMRCH